MGIGAIIFDLGNVIIDFDHTIAAKRIAGFTSKTEEQAFRLFFDSELTGLFEEGRILPEEFFLEVKRALDLRLEYKDFLPIWNEIFFLTEKNRATYALAKALKNHYQVALLSNINILHHEYLKQNFPIFDAFTHIVTSYEVGFKKPHPLIYLKTLEIIKTSAEAVFYTDDRAELVEKAKELGIMGYCFKGPGKLKEDLLASGINIAGLY